MENKLEAYRRIKRRKTVLSNLKEKILNMVVISTKKDDSKDVHVNIQNEDEKPDFKEAEETEEDKTETSPTKRKSFLTYFTYFIYFCFWATLWAIAIELRFGAVFFMFSVLIGIYLNTRTEKRKHKEPSAYSVFNENCEAIDGTLKAEQFEREIGIRHK